MYAFNEDQVATDFYEKRCSASKLQPATAARHRQRALLLQQPQLLRLTAASSKGITGNSSTHGALQHGQQPLPEQHELSWQPQVLQHVAQPLLAAVRPVLRATQQLEAVAGQRWQQLQQRVAAAAGDLRSAARRRRLQQSHPDQGDMPKVTSIGSSSSRKHSRQLRDASSAAAVQGLASLHGVQLQRLALQQIGTPPEWQCESLQMGQSEMPIPAMKAELFTHMYGVLQQSYEVFREVRERLKV
jgi:hypothetical protein